MWHENIGDLIFWPYRPALGTVFDPRFKPLLFLTEASHLQIYKHPTTHIHIRYCLYLFFAMTRLLLL